MDDPVASLCSNPVSLAEANGLPRDPCDRKVEQALWGGKIEASSASLRIPTASSLFARAIYSWASDRSAADSNILKDNLEKIALATAFSADALLDAVQLLARAMASNVTARRNTWLWSREVDPLSQARVANPSKMFTSLKIKRSHCLHGRKDSETKKCFSSFCDSKRSSGFQISRRGTDTHTHTTSRPFKGGRALLSGHLSCRLDSTHVHFKISLS